jgi:hypothetical protein
VAPTTVDGEARADRARHKANGNQTGSAKAGGSLLHRRLDEQRLVAMRSNRRFEDGAAAFRSRCDGPSFPGSGSLLSLRLADKQAAKGG